MTGQTQCVATSQLGEGLTLLAGSKLTWPGDVATKCHQVVTALRFENKGRRGWAAKFGEKGSKITEKDRERILLATFFLRCSLDSEKIRIICLSLSVKWSDLAKFHHGHVDDQDENGDRITKSKTMTAYDSFEGYTDMHGDVDSTVSAMDGKETAQWRNIQYQYTVLVKWWHGVSRQECEM